jgi:hypothetical protein
MMRWWWSKPEAKPEPLTRAELVLSHPDLVAELQAEGARAELARIVGVYRATAPLSALDPLVERLMFDGRTPPEAAALARVASLQANQAIQAEAMRRAIDGPAFWFN